MADYRTIADLEVEQGRIATSQTAFAFRDNPLALAEGAAGAPRISPWALVQTSIAAGDGVRYWEPGQWHSAILGENAQAGSAMILGSGTVRMTADHRGLGGSGTNNSWMGFVRVRGPTSTNLANWTREDDDGWIERSLDVDVLPGDMLQIQHRRNAGTGWSLVRNFGLRTSGAHFLAIGSGSLVLPAEPS